MVICVVGRKNGNFYINRFPLFLIKVDISCMRQVNSSIAFFVHSLIFCNLFKFSLFTSCIFLFIFLLLEKRMLILNQKQRSKFVDQHLQRDPVLPRSIISLRGSVLSFLFWVHIFYILFFSEHKSFHLAFLQRRRDRINEKMKALQELIPRCNKVSWFF